MSTSILKDRSPLWFLEDAKVHLVNFLREENSQLFNSTVQEKFRDLWLRGERIEAVRRILVMHLIMSFSQNILVILEDSWDPESQPSSAVQQQTFVISQLAVLCWRGVWISLKRDPPWRSGEISNRRLQMIEQETCSDTLITFCVYAVMIAHI